MAKARPESPNRLKTIAFIHPDLGIGGAERLVVDAAVGLQDRVVRHGHPGEKFDSIKEGNDGKIVVFTSYCDKNHCFDEARDGTLDVRVRGDSIVPPHIFRRFSILCAILRQLHLVLQTYFSGELEKLQPDVFFVDQLSACLPLLRLLCPKSRILFYCHFPDKLLAQRTSWVKRIYRIPFDWFEGWTMGMSDGIVVNSRFTRGVFAEAFPSLAKARIEPGVVYPCVDTSDVPTGEKQEIWPGKKVLLSINRFERKKDVGLAIRAFAGLSDKDKQQSRLVIAGGYDYRVHENVSYHSELVTLAEKLGLKTATMKNIVSASNIAADVDVLFLLSVPATLKTTLLNSASLLLYTPTREHFGIVPIEAMLAGVPVLAANTGGPLETVVEGKTGWLRPVDKIEQWTEVMAKVLHGLSQPELKLMGASGKARVLEEFSKVKMAERLENEMQRLIQSSRHPVDQTGLVALLLFVGAALVGVFALLYAMLK
ncbi:glycosyltransferase family 4 protein [Xylona heveae TC161]|uniref:Alpha-1,3/1,6-mannosyltransferase ALG2 n=1 Tax=Xylona heveae (strain CBS 132557 / TC161) TaxID=1328760 RepID=A0A164ZS41_XYLHT|nr:glycosyltransferase family 4 protein [Xylona heveae TC161]KZF19442.1 glycosyltransferase family 4 protein [Xylona heveae TC161]